MIAATQPSLILILVSASKFQYFQSGVTVLVRPYQVQQMGWAYSSPCDTQIRKSRVVGVALRKKDTLEVVWSTVKKKIDEAKIKCGEHLKQVHKNNTVPRRRGL